MHILATNDKRYLRLSRQYYEKYCRKKMKCHVNTVVIRTLHILVTMLEV